MSAKDLTRAAKWVRRGDDWTRLADQAQDPYVSATCTKMGSWSYRMAEFFGWEGAAV